MTYRGEIEGRLDPYFYQPEFTKLEAHVRRLTSQKLRDFIVRIAGGSTPDIKRHDEYYTDAHNGVSFIRVQNLSPEGLQLDDCKYVTFNTHNGLLKRSQVSGGDLLVKITGVGRMAVSSVVHYGFEGNINQHIAAIKTQNYQTSEVLATFLNSDIGEKLASRRSTGGTRPALDYSALKSIPIIYNPQIVEIMQSAYAQKKQKEQEADALLDSIDDYVLAELGIEMPDVEEKKCFVVYAGEIEGRIDPEYNHPKFEAYKEPKSYFAFKRIKELSIDIRTGLPIRQDFRSKDGQYPYYGANGIIGYMDDYTHDGRYLVVGQDGYIGNHYVVEGKFWASNHNWVAKFREDVNLDYVKAFLDAWNYEYLITGGVIPKLTKEAFESISIPMPSFEIQEKIADEAMRQRSKAMKLRQEADAIVEEAKREVERVMLEGVSG